jgi:hypothetical protein
MHEPRKNVGRDLIAHGVLLGIAALNDRVVELLLEEDG